MEYNRHMINSNMDDPVYFTKTEVKFIKFCLSQSMEWVYHSDRVQQQAIIAKLDHLSEAQD